jgi:hypothetical protein
MRVTLAICAALCLAGTAAAHPEDMSLLRLVLGEGHMDAVLTLPTRDMSAWVPPAQGTDYPALVVRQLTKEAPDLLEVGFDDQMVTPTAIKVRPAGVGFIEVDATYPMPPAAAVLSVRSRHLRKLPPGHQQALSVEDSRGNKSPTDELRVVAEDVLTLQQDGGVMDLPLWKPPNLPASAPAAPPPPAPVLPPAPNSTATAVVAVKELRPLWACVAAAAAGALVLYLAFSRRATR